MIEPTFTSPNAGIADKTSATAVAPKNVRNIVSSLCTRIYINHLHGYPDATES
ncbi:hypothetical protein [Mesorhizobium xinjiangense]|uniref:hypothetical protein n=1 Tax=Mesorhizobium xinjiangense TaxID=2678685 RepID=UPI001F318F7B|nr:hypothetical protein [Mesorhizobium xinjiangense]